MVHEFIYSSLISFSVSKAKQLNLQMIRNYYENASAGLEYVDSTLKLLWSGY